MEWLEDRRLLATLSPLPSAADGTPGSLREDVITADENLQDNTIVLQAGTYQLTVANTAGHENAAAQGDLNLTPAGHTITIQGQGAGATIIDGGGLDRVFQVSYGVNVVISGVTIQNGIARDAGVAGALPGTQGSLGGGILNEGTLELDGVVIQNCTANGGNGKDGTVGSGGPAAPGLSAVGGGIYNSGILTLKQCIVRNNTAEGGSGGSGAAGALDGTGGAAGAGTGGGLANIGSLTVMQSTIASNNAYGGFGGNGEANPLNAGFDAGAGGDAAGGGVWVGSNSPQTLIIDSTIAGNNANGGGGGQGGNGGQIGNGNTNMGSSGGRGGDGGVAKGGAIDAAAPFSLYNCTVAANQANSSLGGQGGLGGPGTPSGIHGAAGYTGPAFAGGIWAPSDPGTPGLVTAISTIIALNTNTPVGLAATPDDGTISFANAANTLLQDGHAATGITNGTAGNLVGADPKLGPLQDNGGPTPTMALLPGSPAFGAGSNPLGLTTDQRGYSPIGTAFDMGAYQLGAKAPPSGGGGGGATPTVTIQATVVKVKHHRAVRVTDPATGAVKFTVYPFGRRYRGQFAISTVTVNGVEDLVVRRPKGRHKSLTAVFSGIDGSPLPSSLA